LTAAAAAFLLLIVVFVLMLLLMLMLLLQVTAIFYLNQHWKPSHGGQLRLYPFPAPPVDIQPLQDRLVLFSTTRMLHR
jgi:hypothetical protein